MVPRPRLIRRYTSVVLSDEKESRHNNIPDVRERGEGVQTRVRLGVERGGRRVEGIGEEGFGEDPVGDVGRVEHRGEVDNGVPHDDSVVLLRVPSAQVRRDVPAVRAAHEEFLSFRSRGEGEGVEVVRRGEGRVDVELTQVGREGVDEILTKA